MLNIAPVFGWEIAMTLIGSSTFCLLCTQIASTIFACDPALNASTIKALVSASVMRIRLVVISPGGKQEDMHDCV